VSLVTLRGHKKTAYLLTFYDFVEESRKLKTAPEANALIH